MKLIHKVKYVYWDLFTCGYALLNYLQEVFDGSFKSEWCSNQNLEVKMKSNIEQDKI